MICEGQGTLYKKDGSIVKKGMWFDDKMHGNGNIIFIYYSLGIWVNSKGHRYEGEMRKGKKNGHGVLKIDRGRKFEGVFRDDMRHGRFNVTNVSGDNFEVEYRHN